jgi:hypothetical protein
MKKCPGEGSFCSSELSMIEERHHDWSCFERKLQEQRLQPKKFVLGQSPDEDGLCSMETKHDRRIVPSQNCLFWQGDYRNKGHKLENCPGFKSQ